MHRPPLRGPAARRPVPSSPHSLAWDGKHVAFRPRAPAALYSPRLLCAVLSPTHSSRRPPLHPPTSMYPG
ncbi:hypothetical protein E2C01_091614 [Portunus trituberculatus]|uniref:Uncharacterized protein n=1 Tax=Portunus trituberculatus TaxID=210409 RepID=A0A5B7JTB1_PORTR|nr:hypothetical protein [Portunus trituberculatus]